MQMTTMNCTGRSHLNERDSELGDDMSHDDHSDDEMRECDSIEEGHVSTIESRLNMSVMNTNNVSNGVGAAGDLNGSDHINDMSVSHHRQFPPNHPLNALGNFIPTFTNDVLEQLKKQDQEYAAAHAAAFGANTLSNSKNTAFTLPPSTMASYTHASQTGNNINSHLSCNTSSPFVGNSSMTNGSHNAFSFTSPTAPNTKDVNPASNSSTSSETSNSSQQNNGWSFEEQYKQVRQLYEINDDPKRKEFLDDLFSFMQKRGSPINRLPIMAKSVLDLFELYNLVIARGGLVDVINKKLWQEIIKGLHLPSSITSAAFTLRTQYMKYLYPYECEKKNLSTPAELQAAIDGNRREGRRSSYGQYEAMHNQMQMPQIARQSLAGSMQQLSPLALVTHAAAANNQQAQAAAAAAAAHHRLMTPQVPNFVTQELEQRMIEYLKLIQGKTEQNVISNSSGSMVLSSHQQQQHQRQRSPSPEVSTRETLNALEMSRVALWQMYQNHQTSPPTPINISPNAGGNASKIANNCGIAHETQRSEALNLSDSPPNLSTIKRERERETSPEINERGEFYHNQPPPAKRTNLYLPPRISGMNVTATATNYNYKGDHHQQHPDIEGDEENQEDGEHNTTTNSSPHNLNEYQQLNGESSLRVPRHHGSTTSVHNDKSDDSAIENSPSTSAASAGNSHISPLSTKKIHLSKQTQQHSTKNSSGTCNEIITANNVSPSSSCETLNLLSGMQFLITRNGTNAKGEQELAIKLELNGIKYSGILVAANSFNLSPSKATLAHSSTAPATKSTTPISLNDDSDKSGKTGRDSPNNATSPVSDDNETNKDLVVVMDTTEEDTDAMTVRDSDTPPPISNSNTIITNGTNGKLNNTLMGDSITS